MLIGYKLLGKEALLPMSFFLQKLASRFVEADGTLIEELKHVSENKNTKRSTVYWTGVFKQWAVTRGKKEEIENYEVSQLNEALAQFFAEVKKENGNEYEPNSLKVMQASLDRYLRSKNYPKSIVRDAEFLSSRKVLEGKARKLRELGMGKQPNKSPVPYERGRGNITGIWETKAPGHS